MIESWRAEGLSLDPTRRYVTFVGTFHPHSLAPVIIDAARLVVEKLPDVDFLMVGDGHDLRRCKAEVRRLGISKRVIFTGEVANSEVIRYLRASTLLINLSAGSTEGSSMKLLEYMSAGGAVISNTSSAFGLPLTHRKNYYRLPEATPEELARAIEDLIDDEKGAREIGKNARALILSHFSWEMTAESLLGVIDEVRGDH